MKQRTTMREAGSMLKERWLDRRVEKLSRENDKLREELQDLRHDLDAEHGRTKETLHALSKSRRRPGRMKWLVLAGGAYVMGTKAGRARYEQMKGWVRSMSRQDGNGSVASGTGAMSGSVGTTPGATGTTSGATRSTSGSTGTAGSSGKTTGKATGTTTTGTGTTAERP